MNNGKSCFYCATPYHLVTATLLAIQLEEDADLYILPRFRNADSYARNIGELNVFDEVKVISLGNNEDYRKFKPRSLMYNLKKAEPYFRLKYSVRDLVGDCAYQRMYYASSDYVIMLVQAYYAKYHSDLEVIYFDDGDGSYTDPHIVRPGKRNAFIRSLFFGSASVNDRHDKYLYSPELYKTLHPNEPEESVHKITLSWKEPFVRKLVNHIFEIDEDKVIREPCILLDTLRSEVFDEDGQRIINGIYEFIRRIAGDNVIMKRHPRDSSPMPFSFKAYPYDSIPFDGICANMDMNQKILISYNSTALITSKLLLNQEPYIILLYNLAQSKVIPKERIHVFWDVFSQLYVDSSRIMIPESKEELEAALSRFFP